MLLYFYCSLLLSERFEGSRCDAGLVVWGDAARGLPVPKSNWANTLGQAFAVTCGITYTFGGLRIDDKARVLDGDFNPVPGLFAAGELVGGRFYFNYPGGSGLTNGVVFGRIAGTNAAA